ncbi:ATP-dependent endonuclease [Avibacterium sp. 21-586]|uniref:DUF2813 domain-containing protein n=1 Tax=Avibacterium sp. 21-586 TaxID=2911534 RepID=UPI0022454B85|nr:DUF2813 domain-containing protein [Avibacterium sp. 21-586]MCW9709638.1 ATP-dependent endonuclease [Avibacterium sp. 21-586]
MYLRQLDIVGFRGINRLSFTLQPNMVLIGENAWGKSSLLAALSVIFNDKQHLYQFQKTDFYQDENKAFTSKEITFLFTFSILRDAKSLANFPYQQLAIFDDEPYAKIYFQITGEMQDAEIITAYHFLDGEGKVLKLENAEQMAMALIALHPVYRFRDARLNSSAEYQHFTTLPLLVDPKLNREIQSTLRLLQRYFINRAMATELMQDTTALWNDVKSLCLKLREKQHHSLRHILFKQLTQLFVSVNELRDVHSLRPIILFEDPDARLHPRMVAMMWELVSYLPIQRITTTNSVELLSQIPLQSICRLVRNVERTQAFQLSHQLNKEELRRLSFHIRHNRSLALFSRMWLLVEGETEVWILTELAELLDIDLAMEGIRIVEFAQCGLRPLIHYAKAMGIEWYVLTDGDEAGKKYSATAKSLLNDNEPPAMRLTYLPKKDIEHFFYYAGFEQTFIRLARWQDHSQKYLPHRIIQRAIQRTSKPDLAVALSNEIKQRGVASIPRLFKQLFTRVLILARSS